MKRIVTMLALLPVAGCGQAEAEADDELPWGRTFVSSEIVENSQEYPLVPGTGIRLSFERDELTAYAGCNHISGQVRTEGDRLVLVDPGSTLMGCGAALHEQDDWLRAFLLDRPRWQLDGNELVLRTATTELRLLDRTVADRPLLGTRWKVESLLDGDVAESVPTAADAHVVFHPGDLVEGSTGCNTLAGSATPRASTVEFSAVATDTDDVCGDDQASRLESRILAVLDGEVTAEVTADWLTLTHPGGHGLRLRAVS